MAGRPEPIPKDRAPCDRRARCLRGPAFGLAVVLAAMAPLPPTQAGAGETPFSGFGSRLDSLMHAHRIPGMAVSVTGDGRLLWARGFGVADVDERVPITPDTPFWIASVTKTFVGLAFLDLEEAGVVHLDDRMSDVPGFEDFCHDLVGSKLVFKRNLDCGAPITVRTVLTHTSNGVPGQSFMYNPVMFSRLSRYLEWVVNDSTDIEGGMNELARQIQARILGPAGMTRTVASLWDRSKMDVAFDMARGYGVENGRWVLRPPPKRAIAGGAGVVSTVLDLSKYAAALEAGTLASPAVMKKLFTPPTGGDGRPLPYAYGWFVQDYRGLHLVWHSGWDEEAGYSALLLLVPERRLAFAVLANGEGVWWNNPLTEAAVDRSPFARAFLDRFVFGGDRER